MMEDGDVNKETPQAEGDINEGLKKKNCQSTKYSKWTIISIYLQRRQASDAFTVLEPQSQTELKANSHTIIVIMFLLCCHI